MSRTELWYPHGVSLREARPSSVPEPAGGYFTRSNKELIEICKEHRIVGWSGKRKKDLVAMILKHVANANKVQPAPQSKDPEAMEELDELLRKGAEKAWFEFKEELYPDVVVVSEEGLEGSATTT
jgi:hypothetical protein